MVNRLLLFEQRDEAEARRNRRPMLGLDLLSTLILFLLNVQVNSLEARWILHLVLHSFPFKIFYKILNGMFPRYLLFEGNHEEMFIYNGSVVVKHEDIHSERAE